MKLQWGVITAAALELIIIVDLIVINVVLFSPKKTSPIAPVTIPSQTKCGEDCRKEIQEAVQAAVAAMPIPSPQTIQKTIKTTSSGVKEFFVPLGSGSTQNDQWEDIAGVEAYVDTAGYPNIETVYFETSLHIPTKNGTVYARLYNVSDKHPVWFSETSTDSDTSKFVAAQIKLDKGNKLYRVQMKTTLKYPSLLDFARIKIITK